MLRRRCCGILLLIWTRNQTDGCFQKDLVRVLRITTNLNGSFVRSSQKKTRRVTIVPNLRKVLQGAKCRKNEKPKNQKPFSIFVK
jgi:hypothetical protein